jgi:hypothetical protein
MKRFLLICLLLSFGAFSQAAVSAESKISPVSVVRDFYRLYTTRFMVGKDLSKEELSRYVDDELVELFFESRRRSPDEDPMWYHDYFLKAQDLGDDWNKIRATAMFQENGISVVKTTISDAINRHLTLVVVLNRKHGAWKIFRVFDFPSFEE